jgi:hypothetical protein
MPDLIYVPVLKGRQGELAALRKIGTTTRHSIKPLLELVPGPTDEAAVLRSVVDKSIKKLDIWAGNSIFLDAGLLPSDVTVRDGMGALGAAVMKTWENGVQATPVVRLNDAEQVLSDAARVHGETQCGGALRLNAEDMDEDVEDIDDAVDALLCRVALVKSKMDLVLDVGVVNGDLAVRAGSRLVTDVLRGLTNVEDWRQVIVTAGAFPADLSSIQPWVIGELQRFDAGLWDHLRGRRRLTRYPLYGDYSVAHPILSNGPAFPAAPQLRYTVADRWLVLKGRRNDPKGHEQFYDICDTLAAHSDFAGAALGYGDSRIVKARAYGPGNASTWREIGTVHHLDYVVQRLTNLGEP